jgi:hypothetical protein
MVTPTPGTYTTKCNSYAVPVPVDVGVVAIESLVQFLCLSTNIECHLQLHHVCSRYLCISAQVPDKP